MQHRHLTHTRFTLAAIDDIITRGKWDDWADWHDWAVVKAACAHLAVVIFDGVCGMRHAGPNFGG